jgi:hypothetical protein
MSTTLTRNELEHRRKRAVAAVVEGQRPATVAKVLGVDRGSVYRIEVYTGTGAPLLARRPATSGAAVAAASADPTPDPGTPYFGSCLSATSLK